MCVALWPPAERECIRKLLDLVERRRSRRLLERRCAHACESRVCKRDEREGEQHQPGFCTVRDKNVSGSAGRDRIGKMEVGFVGCKKLFVGVAGKWFESKITEVEERERRVRLNWKRHFF